MYWFLLLPIGSKITARSSFSFMDTLPNACHISTSVITSMGLCFLNNPLSTSCTSPPGHAWLFAFINQSHHGFLCKSDQQVFHCNGISLPHGRLVLAAVSTLINRLTVTSGQITVRSIYLL
jgi:hypothetical protein